MNYNKTYLDQQIAKIEKSIKDDWCKLIPIQRKIDGHDDIHVMSAFFIEDNDNWVTAYTTEDFGKAPKFKLNMKATKRFIKIANLSLKLACILFKKKRVSM